MPRRFFDVRQYHLFWNPKVHFTAWIWVMNIIDNAKSFLCISWFDELRRTMEKNVELTTMSFLLQAMRCVSDVHVWMTWQFPRRLMITYTWKVLFQLEASSWLVDNLDGWWHEAHNQSEDNSQKNPKEKILHDESSNTTLGGRVQLDKQRE